MVNKIVDIKWKKEPPESKYKFKFIFKFEDCSTKSTKFGAKGYEDYTIHKDKERRERYINRHKKDLKTEDPTRAGYLSMFILWNKPTFEDSLEDYIKRIKKYNKTGYFPVKIK